MFAWLLRLLLLAVVDSGRSGVWLKWPRDKTIGRGLASVAGPPAQIIGPIAKHSPGPTAQESIKTHRPYDQDLPRPEYYYRERYEDCCSVSCGSTGRRYLSWSSYEHDCRAARHWLVVLD